jgi:hypothetical protein
LVREYQRNTVRLSSNVSKLLNRFFFRIATNVLRVYVRWRLEVLTFQLRRMFDRRTNVQ